MHKYRHVARRNAWDPYDNGRPNYNPFALKSIRRRIEEDESTVLPDDPIKDSVSREEEFARLNPNGKDEPVDDAYDPQPADIAHACLAPVPDGQPAFVVPSHKRPLKGKFGTRSKNKASQKIAEIGLAFIEYGPAGQNTLAHQSSIIFVEYGTRDPLASGK